MDGRAVTIAFEGRIDVPGAEAFLADVLDRLTDAANAAASTAAAAATERNRAAAEMEVRRKLEARRDRVPEMFRGGPLDGIVGAADGWYEYEIVRPNRQARGWRARPGQSAAARRPVGGRLAFDSPSVRDLPAFAEAVAAAVPGGRVVAADEPARTARVEAELPPRLPNPPVEAFRKRWDDGETVRVIVTFPAADGAADRLIAAAREAAGAGGEPPEAVVNRWTSGPGRLDLLLAPVPDAAAFAEAVEFGEVAEVRDAAREVVVAVPAEPGAGDAGLAAVLEPPLGADPFDRRPAYRESRARWAARAVRSNDRRVFGDALDHLAESDPAAEPDDVRAAADAGLLAAARKARWDDVLDLVAALLRRRPDGGFDALREGLRGIDSHALKREVLARLAAADEPGVGFVAADMLGESLLTEPAVEALRRLGPNAEPALIPLLADDRPAMRRDVASLLAEVGTAKAAEAVAERAKTEADRDLARHLRVQAAALRKRLAADGGRGEGE